MATYYNAANNPDFSIALGSPTLAANDTIHINQWATAFAAGLSIAAVKLDLLHIHPQSACDFAASGGLILTTDKLVNNGSGSRAIFNGGGAGAIDVFLNAPARATQAVELLGAVCPLIYQSAGTLTIRDTADASGDVWIVGGDTTIDYSATLFIDGTLHVLGGVVRLRRRAETISLHGGTCVLENGSATQGDITITGGVLILRDSGPIDSVTLLGGALDASGNSRAISVTAWTEHPAATVVLSARTAAITKGGYTAPFGPAQARYV